MSANDAVVQQSGCGVAAANVALLFWNVKELAATNAEQANLDLVYTSIERQRNDYLSLGLHQPGGNGSTSWRRLEEVENIYLKQVELQAMAEKIERATRIRKYDGFVGMIVGGLTIFAAIHYAFKKIVMWAMVVLGCSKAALTSLSAGVSTSNHWTSTPRQNGSCRRRTTC